MSVEDLGNGKELPPLKNIIPNLPFGNCFLCGGDGIEEGCPVCGFWPNTFGTSKKIGDRNYLCIGNTKKYGKSRIFYTYLRLIKRVRIIFFDEAKNRRLEPLPNMLEVWVAEEDVLKLPFIRSLYQMYFKEKELQVQRAKKLAMFNLNDARKKTDGLRHLHLLCVAQCLRQAELTCADIGATPEETQELEEIMSGA